MNMSLRMIRCSPFFRQRATAPRFSVLCTLFLAATEYEFEKEEVGRRRGGKCDFFVGAVTVGLGQEEGSNPLVLGKGGDRGWSDHSGYPPLL